MKITILTKREVNDKPIAEEFDVHSEYPKFFVLSNGKFKFCALKSDIKRGEAIYV